MRSLCVGRTDRAERALGARRYIYFHGKCYREDSGTAGVRSFLSHLWYFRDRNAIHGGKALDVLSTVLDTIRVTGAVLYRGVSRPPWGVSAPAGTELLPLVMPDRTGGQLLLFHVVHSGTCVLEIGDDHESLHTGDVVVLTHGDPHTLADRPHRNAVPITTLLSSIGSGEAGAGAAPPPFRISSGEESTQLICGCFLVDGPTFAPLLGGLPRVVRLNAREGAAARWLGGVLDQSIAEAEASRPGSRSMLTRLTELFFCDVVRTAAAVVAPLSTGWLAALHDTTMNRALSALHGEPQREWTVDLLAGVVGSSRSALAERFPRYLGESPMRYLSRWRMQLAAGLLADAQLTIADTASRVGYDSESSFSRAFKRIHGMPPAAWRRGQVPG